MSVKYIGETDITMLINGKAYEAVGENTFFYCVIDESGEEYLYPKELFEIVE